MNIFFRSCASSRAVCLPFGASRQQATTPPSRPHRSLKTIFSIFTYRFVRSLSEICRMRLWYAYHLSLTRSCRQLRTETAVSLFAHAAFDVHVDHIKDLVEILPGQMVKVVKVLKVCDRLDSELKDEDYLANVAALAEMEGLENVIVRFFSTPLYVFRGRIKKTIKAALEYAGRNLAFELSEGEG
ncbi:hypothetical protein CC86DRAFT_386811 [Ophiobolus disseminans]|uniref:Uncharacterized protein n=1 Tax=Ophiobolus disseminans TaxID=1469910 RepID=A0A6A6ZJR4_9PLEO|nr:hypothetical protein CC86DRAFT_386811 [Ophiobolus disseminans]